jgi:hypothetical protein
VRGIKIEIIECEFYYYNCNSCVKYHMRAKNNKEMQHSRNVSPNKNKQYRTTGKQKKQTAAQ